MIKVMIVDDHDLFAEGLQSMFQPEDGIEIVSFTKNGNETSAFLEEQMVDVILMDISMPIIDGIETMKLLQDKGYDIPILMLTMYQTMRQVKAALEKGAQGYILKDASKQELIKAIKDTSERKNYFDPKITEQVFDYFRGKNSKNRDAQELSEREIEIIKCLAEGKNTKAIADVLFISEHTVRTHRRNIMQKMHVKTSAELIKLAIDKELI